MDNRPFLWMALFFTGYLLFTQWQLYKNPPPAAPVVTGQAATQATAGDIPETVVSSNPATSSAAVNNSVPTTSAAATGQVITVETDTLLVEINTLGGDITSVKLPTHTVSLEDDTPFTLLNNDFPRYIAQSGLLHDAINGADTTKLAPSHYAQYQTSQSSYRLDAGVERLEVPLSWDSGNGVQVQKVFIFEPGKFSFGVEHRVNNGSQQNWSGRQYRQIRHGAVESRSGMLGSRAYEGTAYFDEKYEKLAYKNIAKEAREESVQNTFVSVVQHYFISAWIPEPQDSTEQMYAKTIQDPRGEEYLIGLNSNPVTIAPNSAATFKSIFYVGPKSPDVLYGLAPGLELTSDYGIFTVFSKPIFWVLRWIQRNISSNWGWSIMLLTLLLKLLFFPLSAKGYKSMAKMKTIAPKLADLKDKYGDDKAKYQQAMMSLYKKEKINPLGSCLPILIQIPIFISLYWVLLEAVELRQAPWIGWIKDLSIRDPFFILPVLMGATMWFQQKLNPPQPDPMMQKVLTWMPIIFTVFFLFFPAGLVLYWVLNSVLSIAQQWYITRQIENASKGRL